MLNNGTGRNDTFAAFPVYRALEARQWFEDGDHPAVRRTSYMEIADLLTTSGCSKHEPYWVWSAMGILELPNGKLAVCPGDWILTHATGSHIVVTDEEYNLVYYHQTPEHLSDRINDYLIKVPGSGQTVARALDIGIRAAQLFERRARTLRHGPLQQVFPVAGLRPDEIIEIDKALHFLLDYRLQLNTTGGMTITANRPVGDVLYDQEDAALAAPLLLGKTAPKPSAPRNGEYTETCVARRILEAPGPHIAVCSSQHQLERIRYIAQMNGVAFVELATQGLTRAQVMEQVDAVQPFFKLYRHAVIAIRLLSIQDFRPKDLAFCASYTIHSTQPLSRTQFIRVMKVLKPEAIPADEETIPLRPLDILCEMPKL